MKKAFTQATYKNLKGYDCAGEPVFRRHIRESNVLTKRTRDEKVVFALVFTIFMIEAVSLIVPLLWLLLSSFKETNEFVMKNSFSMPEIWEFDNYAQAFTLLSSGDVTFPMMIFNSVWYTVLSTASSVFMPIIPAYVLSKYNFRGKNFIYNFVITMMMVPLVGTGAAYLKLIGSLGIYNTPLYAIIANMGGFSGNFLVYYGFFKSVSWSYAEAVMMDGGGPFTIFFCIMLPQAVPMIMTFSITGSIIFWNNYEAVMLYMPSYPTLASGLFEFKALATHAIDYPVYFSGLIISMIPTIILFAVFSGRIMGTVSIGGLKG